MNHVTKCKCADISNTVIFRMLFFLISNKIERFLDRLRVHRSLRVHHFFIYLWDSLSTELLYK